MAQKLYSPLQQSRSTHEDTNNRKKIFIILIILFLQNSIFSNETDNIDIAIIGGGINGVYCGNKLLQSSQDDIKTNVHIFEATDRIGGRLFSISLPGIENIPVELGGMRFKDNHYHVINLVDELGLQKDLFIKETPDNYVYLRGVRLRKSDLNHPKNNFPYHLAENEKGKSPDELLAMVASMLVPNFTKMSSEEWANKRDSIRYEGKLLKDISWTNFVASKLSSEALSFLVDVNDVSLVWDTSAISQLDSMVGSSSSKLYKLTKGYQALPLKLAEKFREKKGVVHLDHKLIAILDRMQDKEKRYLLIFENEEGETLNYFAKKIILTISPTALLYLLPKTPLAENEALRKNLNAVSPNVLTKLFLVFKEPWWRDVKLTEGNSITQLPIRSCYYFPSESDYNPHSNNTNSLLLASYQGAFSPFWQSLNASPAFSELSQNLKSVQAGRNAVNQALIELKQVHGIDKIPEPYTAVFQDWGKPPFYAAFYFWNVGFNPREVNKAIRQPAEDHEIYIFTSDFSEHQGWVEPVIENADHLLKMFFKI